MLIRLSFGIENPRKYVAVAYSILAINEAYSERQVSMCFHRTIYRSTSSRPHIAQGTTNISSGEPTVLFCLVSPWNHVETYQDCM
jgi:hypothetical protein